MVVSKKLIAAGVLAALVATGVQAAEDPEFKHFSFSFSAVPTLQNTTNTSVPGESKISDKAYQYQFNYINQPQDFDKGPVGQRLDYYSLRAFAYKHSYVDTEASASGQDGVGSIEGFAVLYGQRYLLADKGYQGLGLGWYAGYAMITDIWVQTCCGSTPTTEKKGLPIAAAEAFYKFNVTPNLYIEPGVTFAWDSKGSNPLNIVPAIIIGGEL